MSLLAEQLLEIHRTLSAAGLPHAFGGAIALAYCTEEPRGTRDLDVNVFVDPSRAAEVLDALPTAVSTAPQDRSTAEREGQVRVWWNDTPIDVFLDVHDFHREARGHIREVPFTGTPIPVLDCSALAVFKAVFDRTRDWADIEEMAAAGTLDLPRVRAWLKRFQGTDSPGLTKLDSLQGASGPR